MKIDDAHGEVSSGQPSNLWGAQTVAFMLAIGLYEPGCKAGMCAWELSGICCSIEANFDISYV